MRLTPIAFAVAFISATAFSYSAQAYCRGCAMSPQAAATAAAAAAAGAAYGSAILGGDAQAYEPPPAADSSATYRPAGADEKTNDCPNGTRRTWTAGGDAPADRVDSCD